MRFFQRLKSIPSALAWFIDDVLEGVFRHIPGRLGPFHIGFRLRSWYWRRKCHSFGDNVLIYENVRLYFPQNISIGSNISITDDCIISAHSDPGTGEITLGDDIFIGPGTYIYSSNHDYTTENIKKNPQYTAAPVVLEGNNWIAAKSGILAGVTVGSGSVAAMGAIIVSDVPKNTLVAGVPAKMVKTIEKISNG
ncbi:MAG: acyltransferase [Pseudodesulfovibrio sp.]|nr:acyltransferase [Pseudodesulfovibrio sp.]